MDRREFLAAGASAAIAFGGGCTGCAQSPSASLRMDPVTDAGIARRVTYRIEADEDDERYRIAAEAVEDGSTTVEGTEPPLPENRPFVHDGAVYGLSLDVTSSVPATSFSFTLDPVEGSAPDDETVRYGDLPAVDREKFARNGWADGGFLGFGSSVLYLDGEIAESALVPEPEHPVIVWDGGTKGRFEVGGSYDTRLETYRYRSRVVDPSASAFGAEVRDRYAFALQGLTAAEREVVREAIEAEYGYSVDPDETPPDAVWRLADRFLPHEEVRPVWEWGDEGGSGDRDGDPSGEYVVRYGGEVYWTSFRVPERTATAG